MSVLHKIESSKKSEGKNDGATKIGEEFLSTNDSETVYLLEHNSSVNHSFAIERRKPHRLDQIIQPSQCLQYLAGDTAWGVYNKRKYDANVP